MITVLLLILSAHADDTACNLDGFVDTADLAKVRAHLSKYDYKVNGDADHLEQLYVTMNIGQIMIGSVVLLQQLQEPNTVSWADTLWSSSPVIEPISQTTAIIIDARGEVITYRMANRPIFRTGDPLHDAPTLLPYTCLDAKLDARATLTVMLASLH